MKKSEETKERILKTAIEIISAKGYHAASTKEIAQEAKVSEGSLFKYFNTKDELLKRIVVKAIKGFQDFTIKKALPGIFEKSKGEPIEILLANFLTDRLEFFGENKLLIKVILQEVMINEDVKAFFMQEIWPNICSVLDDLCEQINADSTFKKIDVIIVKKIVLGTIFYSGILENALGISDDSLSYRDEADSILQVLMFGIKRAEGEAL